MVCSIRVVSPVFIHAKSGALLLPAFTSRHDSGCDGVTGCYRGQHALHIDLCCCTGDHKCIYTNYLTSMQLVFK
jgi:hypothetical protein